MKSKEELEKIFTAKGFEEYKWMDPKEVVVANWVRMKCIFGCQYYGKLAVCPPNIPSVAECRSLFDEYSVMAVMRFAKKLVDPNTRKQWTREVNAQLLDLEREVFLAGFHKAFMLPIDSCTICGDCVSNKSDCKNPKSARPTPEALGVSVFDTVRKVGYPIEVLTNMDKEMNRYAFLLIE